MLDVSNAGGSREAIDILRDSMLPRYLPTSPDRRQAAGQRHDAGRHKLYEMSFDTIEKNIRSRFDAILGGVGPDADHDLAAIIVNRWPRGRASDNPETGTPAAWGSDQGPHFAGGAIDERVKVG